jgi:hypothetical protein
MELVYRKEHMHGVSQSAAVVTLWIDQNFPQSTGEGRPIKLLRSYSGELTIQLLHIRGQNQVPAALPLGKTQYPLYRMLGGPVWRVQKMPPHRDSTP